MSLISERSFSWLFLFLSLSCPPSAFAAGIAKPQVEVLDDGMEIVLLHQPNALKTSMRFVVRSGSQNDASGYAGTAHMLEHLVFHGTYDEKEGQFFDDARGVNASVNAYTSTDWTVYLLDAAPKDFSALAERYLQLVTHPALKWAKLDREKKVIDGEHQLRNVRSILWALDQQLFPHLNQGQTVIGSQSSRKSISLEVLQKYHSQFYRPKNTVALFSGDLSMEEAKRILKAGVLFPPQITPLYHDEVGEPGLPTEIRQRSNQVSVTVGYAMHKTRREDCQGLAALAERRLVQKTVLQESLAEQAQVVCVRLRQNLFLIAMAFTSSPASSQLAHDIDQVLLGLKFRNMTPAEGRALKKRARFLRQKNNEDLAKRTTDLAFALGETGANTRDVLKQARRAPRFSKKKMREVANGQLVIGNRFLLQLSPFEG